MRHTRKIFAYLEYTEKMLMYSSREFVEGFTWFAPRKLHHKSIEFRRKLLPENVPRCKEFSHCQVDLHQKTALPAIALAKNTFTADIGRYNNRTYPIAIHYHIQNMQLNLPSTQICCCIQYMSIYLFAEHRYLHIWNMSWVLTSAYSPKTNRHDISIGQHLVKI